MTNSIPAGPGGLGKSMQHRRWIVFALVTLCGVLAIVSSCSWYLSERIADGALRPNHGPDEFGLEIITASPATVTVRAVTESYWQREGIWALEWRASGEEGWVQVGGYISVDVESKETIRPVLSGEPPPPGAEARYDNFAFLGTPLDFQLDYAEVLYQSGYGQATAWLVCRDRPRWFIHVHGKDGDQREVLRMLPTVADLGFTTLSIDYSNDRNAPGNSTGRFEYGASEWRDVEGAVQYAIEHGADEIVLAGHSMGGAIVASFLLESELASEVSGAVLDAPMLDFKRTVSLGLDEGGVPGPFQLGPRWLSALRFDLDWDRLDYAGRSDDFTYPLLVFHGTDDRTTPIEASDELARLRPDLVVYEQVEGAHHTGAWNVGPDRYESAIRAFVTATLGPAATAPSCAPAR